MQNRSIMDFWNEVETPNVLKICTISGIPFTSWRLMAYHCRPCSPSQYEKMEAAAKEVTPDVPFADYECATRPSVFKAAREEIKRNRAEGVAVRRRNEQYLAKKLLRN